MKYVPAVILALVLPLSAVPLTGTRTVGPAATDYPSLTAALADIESQSVGGALVLELQANYLSAVESFPLVVPALNGASATNTVTIRPASGATALRITSGDTTAATLDLNGAQFLTLDGRPGGTGTAKQLTIANTATTGRAVRFVNEASGNVLRYITLQSLNTSASSGTVVFSTTTGANGNDDNTIDSCDIRDGATTPRNGIHSLGTTATAAQNNSGNTVSNCNIFNFDASFGRDAAGVRLDAGSTGWTISGNSFYQTASRAAVSANVRAIYVNNSSGSNFIVTGNFIGGDSPNAAVTTNKWTTTGTASAHLFQGIRLNTQVNVVNTTLSNVQGNTIRNMIWTTSSNASALPGIWSGIYVAQGHVNIGTVTGNIIGSGTGTGSVSVTTSGTGGTTFGIASAGSGTVAIANNSIGSITVNGSSNSISASLAGIHVTGGNYTFFALTNNLVGSATTANSLNAATSSTGTAQSVTGILSAGVGAIITGNTVANLNNNYASFSAGSHVRGIVASAGVNRITDNKVRNLSTTSAGNGAHTSATMIGISQSSTAVGQVVSQNVVHSLASTVATAHVKVIGIYYASSGPSEPNGLNVIAGNLVHSLAIASTDTASEMFGIFLYGHSLFAQNNMVRVGIKADATSTAGASKVYGIIDGGGLSGRNFYHNSVYVGGVQASGTSSSYAFHSPDDFFPRDFRNNLFVNARRNSGATGKHYAVMYGGATANPNGLTSNNNLFFVSGDGGVLGFYNNADVITLAAWQNATGQDVSSGVGDPLFANATGDATNVDLHLQASNPAESNGMFVDSVTDDFDGQARSSLTPVDIGADAGDFTLSSDVFAPSISYPLLTSGSTANRTLTGWASIVDNSGNIASGPNAPRLYYKKSADADAFLGNTAADNGWKYVTGTDGGSGGYSFTIDYSLINGGSVSAGDTIHYFVAAQDQSDNLGSSPAAVVASATPAVQNIQSTPGQGVFSYSIGSLSGTVTVGGEGSTYPSLSGAGGLFAAMNAGVLVGNLTAKLTGNLTEDGSTVLNVLNANQYPETNSFAVTLQPDSATMRTISGSSDSGLITLNGVDRVTIDGSFGGSGRYLTFRNTSSIGATLTFINDASNNSVRNCVMEGARNVVFFSDGVTTGNDDNTVTGNQIRDRSDAAGVPRNLIYSYIYPADASVTVANSNNTISNNELFNFTDHGVYVSAHAESWSITDNMIYQKSSRTTPLHGIRFMGSGTNTISRNTVRELRTGDSLYGISLDTKSGNSVLGGNRVCLLGKPANSSSVANGIVLIVSAGQSVTVVNNMVALSSNGTAAQPINGIVEIGNPGSTIDIVYNTVLITGVGGAGKDTWAFASRGSSALTVKNNLFLNLCTGGGNHFAANRPLASTGSLAMDSNVYAGTGLVNAANFFDAGYAAGATGTPISHAQWQLNVPSDIHSSASIPGGNYTSAMFANAANGDLHLVTGGNPLVNNTGTPIPGLFTDYDGQLRSATQPYIGADERITPANQPPTFSGYAVSTPPNTPVEIAHAALLTRASDPDGGTLDIISVSASSARSGTVTNIGGNVTYTPPPGYTGLDLINISITDGQGGDALGTVTVNVSGALGTGVRPVQIAYFENGGVAAVLFSGIPAQFYQIQRSTDMVTWSFIESITATNDGNVPFIDHNPPTGSAFYRTASP